MAFPSIVELAKRTAVLERYNGGKLWYMIECDDGSLFQHFRFPIPVEDSGEGDFLPEMKGINLMRWIRKHIEHLKELNTE
jgi:hypothetical protein